MTTSTRSGRRRLGLLLAAATAAAGLAVAGQALADSPPWQQANDPNNDPARVGTLRFYDAAGTEIFSGSTGTAPFAAYVGGSNGLRSGDTLASLFAYLPDPGTPAAGWTGGLLTPTTAFPDAGAPAAVAALTTPVVAGAATDGTLDDFASTHPNTATATGYQNVYELRLRTSAPGQSVTPTYDAADIQITGTSWQVVYPQHFTDTTTTVEVTPSTGLVAGGSATLTATVTPDTATGSVQFKDGSTALGSPVNLDNAGHAQLVTKLPHAGSRSIQAVFTPTGGSQFAGSSDSVSVAVAKAASTVAATWPSTAVHYGTSFSIKAKVTAAGLTPTGTVSVKDGSRVVASKALTAGAATLTVPATALKPGSHSITLAYGGSADVTARSTGKKLTVAKAIAHVSNVVSPKTVRTTKHATLAVKVTATGTTPTGTVTVYDGSKKIATGRLSHGKVTITLPRITKRGKHKLHASYGGSTLVAAGAAAAVTLTVVK